MKLKLAVVALVLMCGSVYGQTKQTMINSPGGIQSGGDAPSFPCVAATGAKTFDQQYAIARKLFTATDSPALSDRECLVSQWFFGQGLKQGYALTHSNH